MMNILAIVGALGVIGTVGALDCDVITFGQALIQMTVCGFVTVACFVKSDFIA